MKKQKLSLKAFKESDILSPGQLKSLMGGLEFGSGSDNGNCQGIGKTCNSYIQCCSLNCVDDPANTETGKSCKTQ